MQEDEYRAKRKDILKLLRQVHPDKNDDRSANDKCVHLTIQLEKLDAQWANHGNHGTAHTNIGHMHHHHNIIPSGKLKSLRAEKEAAAEAEAAAIAEFGESVEFNK